MADYVVSSAHFPQGWTGEQCLGDGLLATFRSAGQHLCLCRLRHWLAFLAVL